MINVGEMNILNVLERKADGVTLSKESSSETVFLPEAHISKDLMVGSEVVVFVYRDTNSGRLLASLNTPIAMVGEFGFLRVKEIHEFGSFVEWGIEKDLLVPGNEQKEKFGSHGRKLIRVCMEEDGERIFGTTKFGKYIAEQFMSLEEGERVNIQPTEKTKLGYRCIVEKKYLGMIYHSEVFEKIDLGVHYSGVVKNVRDDGLIDVALQTQGVGNLYESSDKVLNFLNKVGGSSHLNDKSSPEEIKRLLAMSKKTFKSAIGILYKQRKITISKDGIRLS